MIHDRVTAAQWQCSVELMPNDAEGRKCHKLQEVVLTQKDKSSENVECNAQRIGITKKTKRIQGAVHENMHVGCIDDVCGAGRIWRSQALGIAPSVPERGREKSCEDNLLVRQGSSHRSRSP